MSRTTIYINIEETNFAKCAYCGEDIPARHVFCDETCRELQTELDEELREPVTFPEMPTLRSDDEDESSDDEDGFRFGNLWISGNLTLLTNEQLETYCRVKFSSDECSVTQVYNFSAGRRVNLYVQRNRPNLAVYSFPEIGLRFAFNVQDTHNAPKLRELRRALIALHYECICHY